MHRRRPPIIDLDATLVTAHSKKEYAAPNFKRGFGFHPLYAFVDHALHARPGLRRHGLGIGCPFVSTGRIRDPAIATQLAAVAGTSIETLKDIIAIPAPVPGPSGPSVTP